MEDVGSEEWRSWISRFLDPHHLKVMELCRLGNDHNRQEVESLYKCLETHMDTEQWGIKIGLDKLCQHNNFENNRYTKA